MKNGTKKNHPLMDQLVGYFQNFLIYKIIYPTSVLQIGIFFFSLLYLTPSFVLAFDAFEHRYIGNAALKNLQNQWANPSPQLVRDWELALAELGIDVAPRPSDTSGSLRTVFDIYRSLLPLEFGDLPALAGDHSETPQELHEILKLLIAARDPNKKDDLADLTRARIPLPLLKRKHTLNGERNRFVALRRQWQNVCAWILRDISDSSLQWEDLPRCLEVGVSSNDNALLTQLKKNSVLHNPLSRTEGYQPSRTELAEFEQLIGYISLASENESHFPRSSWKWFSWAHREALRFANTYAQRALTTNDNLAYQDLSFAILYEGFAQHFLHDSFASGHLGTPYTVQKELLQHIHDSLNKNGIIVQIPGLPNYLWPDQKEFKNTLIESVSRGWTAFGDGHLFIPQATFHRFIVVHFATKSLQEVFDASKETTKSSLCFMCTELIFPIPVFNTDPSSKISVSDIDPGERQYQGKSLASPRDPNISVSPLYDEGWRLLAGIGFLGGPWKDGGNTFDLSEVNGFFDNRKKSNVTAASLELGYLRSTAPGVPNYFGIGTVLAPSVRTSIYPFSIGYWFPSEITTMSGGLFGGIRANLGLRIDEAGSFLNAGNDDIFGGEATIVLDIGYRIRSPISIFGRLELVTANLRGRFIEDLVLSFDSPYQNGVGAFTFGIIYDIGEVIM